MLWAVSCLASADFELGVNVRHIRPDGEYSIFPVADGDVVRSGDEFQVRLKAGAPAYLYVLIYSSSGNADLLHPLSGRAGDAWFEAGMEKVVPSADGAFSLDDNVGTESVYALSTGRPIIQVNQLLQQIERAGSAEKIASVIGKVTPAWRKVDLSHLEAGVIEDIALASGIGPDAGSGHDFGRSFFDQLPAGGTAAPPAAQGGVAAAGRRKAARPPPAALFAGHRSSDPVEQEVLSGVGSRIAAIFDPGGKQEPAIAPTAATAPAIDQPQSLAEAFPEREGGEKPGWRNPDAAVAEPVPGSVTGGDSRGEEGGSGILAWVGKVASGAVREPEPESEPQPQPQPEPEPEPEPEPVPAPASTLSSEPAPEPAPAPEPGPEPGPGPEPELAPVPEPVPAPEPSPALEPAPEPATAHGPGAAPDTASGNGFGLSLTSSLRNEVADRPGLAEQAVVQVASGKRSGVGVVIGDDGTVLTHWHVIRGQDRASVIAGVAGADGRVAEQTYPARVLRHQQFTDLALLRVESLAGAVKPVTLAPVEGLVEGATVSMIGYESSIERVRASGVLAGARPRFSWFSGANVIHNGHVVIARLDTPQAGEGALFNARAQLLGLSAFTSKNSNHYYAVSAEAIKAFLAGR